MNILQLAPLYGPINDSMDYGSIERIVKSLDKEFVDAGHTSLVIAMTKSKIVGNLVSIDPSGKDQTEMYENQAQIALQQIKNANIDLIQIHRRDFLQTTTYLDKISKLNIPIVITLHGTSSEISKKYSKLNSLKKIKIISVSQSQDAQLINILDPDIVIYNGIEVNSESNDIKTKDHLSTLGRIARSKGIHTAIKVTQENSKKLIIAGVILSSEDKEYWKKEIYDQIDGEQISFVGAVNDQQKYRLLQSSLALLMPIEREEPCSLVVLESLAMGTPVIGFNRGSLGEIIKNGINGFVVDNTDEMIESIKNIDTIDNNKCISIFNAKYTSKIMAKNYLDFYKYLIYQK